MRNQLRTRLDPIPVRLSTNKGIAIKEFMIRRRRIEIIASTEQRVVLRHAAVRVDVGCIECGTRMVTPDEAAIIARVDTRTIYRWVEIGTVHFTEHECQLWVCLNSLPIHPQSREA